jgi:hypothetical protein
MDLLSTALEITGIGMAGIFIFMFIFYISIRLLNTFFPGTPEKPEK